MTPFNPLEKIICGLDTVLRTVWAPSERTPQRPNPAANMAEPSLNKQEKKHVAGLMRVNHAGEVCAQALYQGQALTAKLPYTREQMENAAREEVDHLAWCEQRLKEINSQPSLLNVFWYSQSFLIGALAGLAGDNWSLGFVAETERQVTAHLEEHLTQLPPQDIKTKRILEQMQTEEAQHADMARQAGANELPLLVQKAMRLMAKVMTITSYYF